MSAPSVTLVTRAERLVLDLEAVLLTLRQGIADGGLSLPKQRWLVRELRHAPALVSELRGAMDAYRLVATSAGRPSGAVLPLDLAPAADRHLSDEDLS